MRQPRCDAMAKKLFLARCLLVNPIEQAVKIRGDLEKEESYLNDVLEEKPASRHSCRDMCKQNTSRDRGSDGHTILCCSHLDKALCLVYC